MGTGWGGGGGGERAASPTIVQKITPSVSFRTPFPASTPPPPARTHTHTHASSSTYGIPTLLKELVDQGGFGVTIFFVLSGFLIPLVLVRGYRTHGRINLRRFMWHRFLRVWPALNT